MKKVLICAALFACTLLSSCDDSEPENPNATIQVSHNSACVINLGQVNCDCPYSLVYLVDSVFDNSGNLVKVITHLDSIPSLGMTRDTLETDKTAENTYKYIDDDGDEQTKTETYYLDTVITHPKHYQLFITVSKN